VDLEVVANLKWPDLFLDPINLWNVPYMDSKKVIELAKILETTNELCPKDCKIDVWKERCTNCKRTLEQIENESL
jgi:hypothetical protein